MKLIFFLTMIIHAQNSFAETLSLDQYVTKVSEQSLDLKIEQSKSEALSAKSLGYLIPPPMIGFSQMKEIDGSSATGFEVNQMIPFPTKLFKDHSARKYEFQSQEESRLGLQKQTLLQAKILYLLLWQSQVRLSLLEQKKDVLQNHIKISRSTARSDSFAVIHVLKAESDFDLLDNEIEAAQQILNEKQFEVATFINKDPSSFNLNAVEPKISSLPKASSIENSHLFKAKILNLKYIKSKESNSKSSWLPDFNLRYKEMGATNSTMKYSELMVGITLPFVFFWEPYAISKQAGSDRLRGEYELEKEKRNFNSDKLILFGRANSLRKQIDTLNNKLIPRAEKRMKLVRNLAPRDLETLQDHRETMEALPELKMKALGLRMEYERTIADLEKYESDEDLEK